MFGIVEDLSELMEVFSPGAGEARALRALAFA